MPHNQDVRDALFHALCNGPVGLTAGQAAALVDTVIEPIEQELEDARMFRWISSNATIKWDTTYENAQIGFPLKADFFDTVEDAVRKAMGNKPEEN